MSQGDRGGLELRMENKIARTGVNSNPIAATRTVQNLHVQQSTGCIVYCYALHRVRGSPASSKLPNMKMRTLAIAVIASCSYTAYMRRFETALLSVYTASIFAISIVSASSYKT